jgi:bifunctional DNase/RNase
MAMMALGAIALMLVYASGPAASLPGEIGGIGGEIGGPLQTGPGLPARPPGPFFAPSSEFLEQNVLRVADSTVTIGRDCMAIVSDTSPERAEALEIALAGVVPPRPTAYDGWASMLERYNISFEATTIHAFDGNAYLSRAIFRWQDEVLDLDMRPSDAMALAVRTGTPIYLNMTLLRQVGRNVC